LFRQGPPACGHSAAVFFLSHDFRLAVANNGGIDLVNSAGLPDPHAYWRKMKTFDDPASLWDAHPQMSLERGFCGYRGL
jgi:hypothetical protein